MASLLEKPRGGLLELKGLKGDQPHNNPFMFTIYPKGSSPSGLALVKEHVYITLIILISEGGPTVRVGNE